ncbi:MAG: methyltransferase domain-containing protein [Dehalococcoidia bacterium]
MMIDQFAPLLVCPRCRSHLTWSADEARCESCASRYPIVDGIPILVTDQAATDHDELEHHHSHKQQQAHFFDRNEAAEFEITRPHGTARLYQWLLREKFRRSVKGLESLVRGGTAVTVCSGSGMDAEYLARLGSRVLATDISLGAARRTQERARRFRLQIGAVVADVERLPFADQAIDLVYVHDGLHHLENPAAGLVEMARVAKQALSVTEPANAAATNLAVRLGWSLEREEAGNRVARLTPAEVVKVARSHGFRIIHARRYAMYYRHEPGAVFRWLSLPGVFPLITNSWRAANALIGDFGNKLSVVALRRPLGSHAKRPITTGC